MLLQVAWWEEGERKWRTGVGVGVGGDGGDELLLCETRKEGSVQVMSGAGCLAQQHGAEGMGHVCHALEKGWCG